jgi:ADP-heptose:LPS heptosyltransferase
LESISPSELAVELLNHCLRGDAWPTDVADALAVEALDEDERLAAPATHALFSILVENLADRFEPRLARIYAALFARVVEQGLPELHAADLIERYDQIRQVRPVLTAPDDVFVLSRVTLGADVAITSILLDGARRRFPQARLWFVGPGKAWELFERSPDVRHIPIAYGRRGLLSDRLGVFADLREALSRPNSIVLDPDSRLTQLGLLPVCPAGQHYLFESRAYGGETTASLPELARQWVRETLGVEDAQPWLHPKFEYDFGSQPVTTVSLGVGENPAKRLEDPFEERLLALLTRGPEMVMVDAGAPASEEERRVRAAIETLGPEAGRIGVHEGSFASFAAMIAASTRFVGYDSAGQHVAAALGIPLICVFAGYANRRMAQRWAPASDGPADVLDAAGRSGDALLGEIAALLAK